jgi:hypothetical protein
MELAMPDDNEFARLNMLMNSDGAGGVQFVKGRSAAWTPGADTGPPPAGCQVFQGTYSASGRNITSTMTVRSTLGFDQGDRDRIFRWFFEDGELHQSNKVKNPPAGYMGYLHDYGRNRLYAVTAIDEGARLVAIPAIGKVNDGWHIF